MGHCIREPALLDLKMQMRTHAKVSHQIIGPDVVHHERPYASTHEKRKRVDDHVSPATLAKTKGQQKDFVHSTAHKHNKQLLSRKA